MHAFLSFGFAAITGRYRVEDKRNGQHGCRRCGNCYQFLGKKRTNKDERARAYYSLVVRRYLDFLSYLKVQRQASKERILHGQA
jgi:hypothetical protein